MEQQVTYPVSADFARYIEGYIQAQTVALNLRVLKDPKGSKTFKHQLVEAQEGKPAQLILTQPQTAMLGVKGPGRPFVWFPPVPEQVKGMLVTHQEAAAHAKQQGVVYRLANHTDGQEWRAVSYQTLAKAENSDQTGWYLIADRRL